MAPYVAFLRGVNVGKNRKVPMAALRGLLDDAGYAEVRTYVQSGNVVLDTPRIAATKLEAGLEALVARHLLPDVAVLVRTPAQLRELVAANPFSSEADRDHRTVHALFLKSTPSAAAVRHVEEVDFGAESFVFRAREVYLHYPDGMGRSKMTTAFFEKQLGVAGSARNWRTVRAVLDLAEGREP